jgi:hypothetical protein
MQKGDISSFHGTANSLPNAIGKIEGAIEGKVVEMRFGGSDGMPGYHVVVAKTGNPVHASSPHFSHRRRRHRVLASRSGKVRLAAEAGRLGKSRAADRAAAKTRPFGQGKSGDRLRYPAWSMRPHRPAPAAAWPVARFSSVPTAPV